MKPIYLTLSLLSIGLFVYFTFAGRMNDGSIDSSKKNLVQVVPERSANQASRNNTAKAESGGNRRRELEDAVSLSMAKSAGSRNQKLESLVIAAKIEARRPSYARLLKSWAIGNETISKVFQLIYQKELQLMELRHQRNVGGLDALNSKVEATDFYPGLRTVLGPDKAKEFVDLEARLDGVERAQARKLVQNRSGD